MGVESSSGGARGGGAVSQEPLDGEVVVRLEAWGNVGRRNVFNGKDNFNFRAGGGLEGGGRGHWQDLMATLLLDRVLLSS